MGILDRMNFRALDSDFNATEIVEGYDSIIWTDKYNDVGDFEIQGANNDLLRSLANGASYIFNSVTSGLMVIEKPAAEYDDEDGSTITITGRSMASVLDRRVMLAQKTILFATDTGDRRISTIICGLINDAFGPTDAARYWKKSDGTPAFQVIDATVSTDESVKLTVGTSLQITLGDSLLKIVTDLCVAFNLGFKCELSLSDKIVKFIIYEGVDLSQPGENFIMFSDLYDNLLTGKETISIASVKDTVLVVGSSVDPVTQLPRLPQVVSIPNPITSNPFTGLDRRETYFSSSQLDTSTVNGEECAMSSADYIAALQLAGKNELAKSTYQIYTEYAGEIIEVPGYQCGVDFNLGDIVAFLLPHHTQTFPARIDGMTFSDDADTGKTLAPSFNYLFTTSVDATPVVASVVPTVVPSVTPPASHRPMITLTTFGYNMSGGKPSGQKYVMDARNIDTTAYNWGPTRNGLDPAISKIVLGKSTAKKDLDYMKKHWLPNLVDGDKIAIGCKEGHHRSVALAEGPSPKGVSMKYVLIAHGFNVKIVNRDMKTPY